MEASQAARFHHSKPGVALPQKIEWASTSTFIKLKTMRNSSTSDSWVKTTTRLLPENASRKAEARDRSVNLANSADPNSAHLHFLVTKTFFYLHGVCKEH